MTSDPRGPRVLSDVSEAAPGFIISVYPCVSVARRLGGAGDKKTSACLTGPPLCGGGGGGGGIVLASFLHIHWLEGGGSAGIKFVKGDPVRAEPSAFQQIRERDKSAYKCAENSKLILSSGQKASDQSCCDASLSKLKL